MGGIRKQSNTHTHTQASAARNICMRVKRLSHYIIYFISSHQNSPRSIIAAIASSVIRLNISRRSSARSTDCWRCSS
eukprot:m.292429 g.292429  ORF g.292429 m.292429 type:complete len:77 (-) comp15840_c0_seq3:120-350(-)